MRKAHAASWPPPTTDGLVDDILRVLRLHLRMEVAFVGRVRAGQRRVEHLDKASEFTGLPLGSVDPLHQTLCGRVLSRELPAVVHDARTHPAAADLPATSALPVGAHLSVPVPAPDGRTLGTLCCFSRHPDPALDERDAELMRAFAEIVGTHLQPRADEQELRHRLAEEIGALLDSGGPAIALQPIVDLGTRAVLGYEALARFPAVSDRSVEEWFDAAGTVGMAGALEAAAVHAAIRILPQLPDALTLAVNVSATSLTANPSIARMLSRYQPHRVVLELTEHHRIDDLEAIRDVLKHARANGVRVALDDTGSGYSGLQRLVTLGPEIVKLDRALVQGVSHHPGRAAMCEAMASFAVRTGIRLIAEGIEDRADLRTLTEIGITAGQGYLLGRPQLAETYPWSGSHES